MSKQQHLDESQLEQRVLQLINGDIDGQLNAKERVELEQRLATSEQVRDLNKELRSVANLLDELPEREPPDHLQTTIERQIRLPHQDNTMEKQVLGGKWSPARWFQTGFAMAAGAILTIGIYEMWSGPITSEDFANMSGTIVQNTSRGQGDLLDSAHIVTDTLSGTIALRKLGDLFTLDVELSADGPTQVVLEFGERGLEYEGLSSDTRAANAVSVTDSTVKVESMGVQQYSLNLRRTSEMPQAAPLLLEFFENNTLVLEAKMDFSRY